MKWLGTLDAEVDKNAKIFYRYEDRSATDWTEACTVELEFRMLRETRCGYWIEDCDSVSGEKWVSKTSRKRFAYPTKEEAMVNFKARKNSQLGFLESKIKNVTKALAHAELKFAHICEPKEEDVNGRST